MSFKQVSFIEASGRKWKPREAKDGRGKLEGDIRSFRRIASSLAVEIARRTARRASRACLFGTVVSRYEDIGWSRQDQ